MVIGRRPRNQYRVFFSHSHQDRWIATQRVKLIEQTGGGQVKAFPDEKDLEAGQSIQDSIRKEIARCDEFVVLLSPNSKDRPWVLIEIGAARQPILNDFDQYLSQ